LYNQGGAKLERARDLFEQALEKCPEKFCKPLFLMYAQLEEEHGLAKRAMGIYDRAATAVQDTDKMEVSLLVRTSCTDSPADTGSRSCSSDVYHLHRQSCRQFWSSRHPIHLPACHRSLAGQADLRHVLAFRCARAEIGRDRPCARHLRSRLAVLRSPNVHRLLVRMERFRK
jgi:hypothetical protein